MGCNNGKLNNIEYEDDDCAICLDKMVKNVVQSIDRTFNCQKCNKKMHDVCWRTCINIDGKCPCCRQQIVADEHMKTIRFSQEGIMSPDPSVNSRATTYYFSLQNGVYFNGKSYICYSYN